MHCWRSPRGIPGGKSRGRATGRVHAIHHNPDRPYLEDLDALPLVTEIYHRDLKMEDYQIPYLRYPYVSFYTGRGCPSHCVYCLWPQTFTGRRYRVRSVPNVVAEVRRSLELFPQAAEIFFDDDTFTANGERARSLSREFRRLNQKFLWSTTARVTTSYETLKAMKEGGLRLLVVGFETGDPQVLKNIRKGATLDLGRRMVKWCKELGIQVHGTFMVGLPGETPASLEASMRFACKLDPDTIQVSLATPYPGTEFYDFCRERGYMADRPGCRRHRVSTVRGRLSGLTSRGDLQGGAQFYRRFYFRPRPWPASPGAWSRTRWNVSVSSSRGRNSSPSCSAAAREGDAGSIHSSCP